MVYTDFINDCEKMHDFRIMSKEAFLESYSYLTEKKYDLTVNHLYVMEIVSYELKRLTDDYASRIYDAIINDVISDIDECADDDFNDSDIHLAIGRAICSRIGIEF